VLEGALGQITPAGRLPQPASSPVWWDWRVKKKERARIGAALFRRTLRTKA